MHEANASPFHLSSLSLSSQIENLFSIWWLSLILDYGSKESLHLGCDELREKGFFGFGQGLMSYHLGI